MRNGNFVRGSNGGFPGWLVVEVADEGMRRDLALGRERNPGQVWDVGGPVRAKIWCGCKYWIYGLIDDGDVEWRREERQAYL